MQQIKTIDSAILELIAAFDKLPHKGLYFWTSLLLPGDFDYKNFIQNKSSELLSENTESKSQYDDFKEIIDNLQQIRAQVLLNPQVKLQIEKIKENLISTIASEIILDKINATFN